MFMCFKCNKGFYAIKTLVGHLKCFHPYLPKYECKQCDGRSYRDINGLRKHLISHELTSEPKKLESINVNDNVTNIFKTPAISPEKTLSESEFSDLQEVDYDINSILTSIVTKLYANQSLNRATVHQVLMYNHELIDNIFLYIKKRIKNNAAISIHIDNLFNEISSKLLTFATEYRRIKYLEQKKLLIKPKTFTMGTSDNLMKISSPNCPELSVKQVKGENISIKETLESFLKLPNVYDKMVSFIQSEEDIAPGIYTSVFQGTLWKSMKQNFENKTVFPIYFFFDDFEPLNPLGSRAGAYKIGALYMSLASVPHEYSSLLDNIFLTQLIFTSDRTTFGNEAVFKNIIEELKLLEGQGISINICGEEKTIYFVLLLMIGDNLGLNSVMGFTESFNAEHFCRICLAPKSTTQREINESQFVLRTKENYDLDLETLSHGIKEKCVWHDLQNFHVTQNFSCDLMHDCLEGILRYDMASIISGLLNKKYFDFDLLNNRIKFFNFSRNDAGNAMPLIKLEHLRKKQIIMSASEMLALTVYFGILVGDLVPDEEPIWNFYILLVKIVDILLERLFTEQLIEYLQLLIKEHHSIYMDLFQENLKPKYHLLLHYPTVIRRIGPPRFYWCMRYEAFHRLLKQTAKSVTCRKNLLHTLSLKQQLRMSNRFLCKKGFEKKIEFGPRYSIPENILKKFELSKNVVGVSWININNIIYRKDFSIQFSETQFAQIKYMLTNEGNIYFLLKPLETVGFAEHVQAFQIKTNSYNALDFVNALILKSFSDMNYFKQVHNMHFAGNGCCFISVIK